MSQEFKELAETLEREAGFYEELVVVLDKEREIIRRMDVVSLEENNGIKANLVGQISRLEKTRTELMSSLALSQGLPGQNLRLNDLLRKAPAPLAGRLLEVRARLRRVATEVTERNDWNQHFILELLGVMEGIVERLRALFTEPALYGEKGNMDKGTLNGGELLQESA